MTTAEQIADTLGNDGLRFAIETEDGEITLDELCEAAGASENWARTDYDEDDYGTRQSVMREVSRGDIYDHHRYAFSDGSAIVVSGDAWDLEGSEPFSWAGAEVR